MIGRLKQQMQEKTGTASKTTYGIEFDQQVQMMETTKTHTEKLVEKIKDYLNSFGDSSSGLRIVEGVGERSSAYAQALPTNSGYRNTLAVINSVHQEIGAAQRHLQNAAEQQVCKPLRAWIRESYVEFTRERDILKKKRLDMDAMQNKARAGTAESLDKLENATSAHQKQLEVVKNAFALLPAVHAKHRNLAKTFMELERDYFRKCAQSMQAALEKN